MKVLVTGARGFIGKNLVSSISVLENIKVYEFNKDDTIEQLNEKIIKSDFIVHLAGINRTKNNSEFIDINDKLTKHICNIVYKNYNETNKKIPILFTSSTQAKLNNEYGISKLNGEKHLEEINEKINNPIYILRLPNVFGKWCKPNYNSVVATFCNNIANGIPIKINDPKKTLNLVYIDDLIKVIINIIINQNDSTSINIYPQYKVTLKDLANKIQGFKKARENLIINDVGEGFDRCLYATYLSYIKTENFSYKLNKHVDSRGIFVEFLKTSKSGQFSFFTAHPGVRRGGHYHHTKNEKFLVLQGTAKYSFINIQTKEIHDFIVDGSEQRVVDTVPGWGHSITNIGTDELIVLLWSNEIFEPNKPDTFSIEF